MVYDSMPYVGMTPEKMAATLKVHKWHARNVCARLVNSLTSHTSHYCDLLWRGLLTLLEKVPDRQVAKTSNSSYFSLSCTCLPFSMITAEVITDAKNSINHQIFHPPLIVLRQRAPTSRQFPGDPTLIHATICHFVILGECRTLWGKRERTSQWVGKLALHQHSWQGSHCHKLLVCEKLSSMKEYLTKYMDKYHTMEPFILPKQLHSLDSNVYTLKGRNRYCWPLSSVNTQPSLSFTFTYRKVV